MIMKNLKEVMDNSLEVFIQMNYCCSSKYVGRVIDLDDKFFTLLSFKQDYRMQLVFKTDDIKYICLYKDNIINFNISEEVTGQASKLIEQDGGL